MILYQVESYRKEHDEIKMADARCQGTQDIIIAILIGYFFDILIAIKIY